MGRQVADSYRKRNLVCPNCGATDKPYAWETALPLDCIKCGEKMANVVESVNQAPGIATDDIPGGIEIRHGICNEDGSPKRYYSKTDIKRACNEKGVTIYGDTPKKYKV